MKHPADTTSKMTLTKVIRPELACQRHDSFPVTVWNVILEMAVNSNGGAKEKVWKTKANDQTAMMVDCKRPPRSFGSVRLPSWKKDGFYKWIKTLNTPQTLQETKLQVEAEGLPWVSHSPDLNISEERPQQRCVYKSVTELEHFLSGTSEEVKDSRLATKSINKQKKTLKIRLKKVEINMYRNFLIWL